VDEWSIHVAVSAFPRYKPDVFLEKEAGRVVKKKLFLSGMEILNVATHSKGLLQ